MDDQAQRLVRLLEVCSRMATERDLDPLLQTVANSARQFLEADLCGLLALSDEDPSQFAGIWVSGWDSVPRHYPTGVGIFNLPLKTGKPLRVDHVPTHPSSVGVPDGHPPIGPFLGVPLRVKDTVLGTLFVARITGGRAFTAEDEELLVTFAGQAAVAIYNSRLYRQAEELAILRERERMAVNLHDTVAQIFFSIGMELDDLKSLVPADRLEYIRSLVVAGSRKVREAIGHLYDEGGLPAEADLHRRIATLVAEFQREHKLQVGLVVSGPVSRLPQEMAEVLFRAVREGLANVRKHSGAELAVVSLAVRDGMVSMTIQDNGVGVPEEVMALAPHIQRFGLVAIRRQVERLGGACEISNGDESGCVLRVWVPVPSGVEEGARSGAHSHPDRG